MTTDIQKECRHEVLRFGSGAYYIFCAQCSQPWVAIRNDGSDTDIDYEQGSNPRSGEIRTGRQS